MNVTGTLLSQSNHPHPVRYYRCSLIPLPPSISVYGLPRMAIGEREPEGEVRQGES